MKNNLLLFVVLLILFSCANPVPRKPVSRKTSSFMSESVLYNKSLNAEEEQLIRKFMEKDSLNPYIASSYGFWYRYQKKSGATYFPIFGDQVVFNYEISDLSQNVIYSRDELGEKSYVVDKQEIEEGLRHGLKLMHEGDIITFLFPSHKVFGLGGDQNKITKNQSLIYKVQLNKINKKNENN